jgi:hypothetical protein
VRIAKTLAKGIGLLPDFEGVSEAKKPSKSLCFFFAS